jgi:serine/threonine protein kinase/tetratricopeptide (TPR) repeat protein
MTQPNLRRLGDFEIAREVGRGGMGVVYEALQVSLNRRVALKVLSGSLGLTPKAVQRFRREAEAAAKLHHTNIVPVYATGEEDNTHFYAMELIDGPSLDHLIRQMRGVVSTAGPNSTASGDGGGISRDLLQTGLYVEGTSISGGTAGLSSTALGPGSGYFDTLARMLAEVAEALEYAHEQGVVHRDMKPSNLLLSPAGRLSINDFGLARMLEQPGMTMTGEFVGTPAYMSPEQITAGRTPLDHRTDIYSLGATLYELLTLHPPFAGDRRDQVLTQILHKEPKAPRQVNPKVPVDLETICLKAMEKDPDRRYQTAGAMAEDLRRHVNRFPILARRAGPVERLRKWTKRHPGLTAGVGLALVAIILAGFFADQFWRERQDRIAAAAAARRQLLKEKVQQAQDHMLNGNFASAEDAIRAAEELEAPEEWVQWRRGQIAFHRGEIESAVHFLEPAVDRMPTNLAANSLLGAAYLTTWNWQEFFKIVHHCASLEGSAPEDLLYKAVCDSFFSPTQALKTLDHAMAQQPCLIAHLLRAQILANVAMETTDLARAEMAMQDVTAAKTILRGNVLALVESVHVHQVAAILYGDIGQADKHDQAQHVARADADALAQFPDVPLAVECCGDFLENDGQEEKALRVYEKGMQQKEVGLLVARNYAFLLYKRGKAREAVEVLERHVPAGFLREFSRGWIVAELPDGPRLVREISAQMPVEPAEFRLVWRCIFLCYLGKNEEARDLLRGIRPDSERIPARQAPGFGDFLDFLREPDAVAEMKFLEGTRQSKSEQTLRHFLIGVVRLGEGGIASAREHFKKSVGAHDPYARNYKVSRAFLARMKDDPTWPRWIDVKK